MQSLSLYNQKRIFTVLKGHLLPLHNTVYAPVVINNHIIHAVILHARASLLLSMPNITLRFIIIFMKKIVAFYLCSLLISTTAFNQSSTEPIINSLLNGRITDDKTGQPLEGAVVQIKGTTHEVITNQHGEFSFKTGQKFPYILVISYVGYEGAEFTAATGTISIQLKAKPGALDDVVVVGYGTQKRKDLIGSVSKVNLNDVKTIPEASFDAQLQGKAAGVQINTNTGVPGSDVFIRVRGATSINASNDPLYVIDGVVVNNVSLQNIAQDRTTSPLADLNPNDIASVEILKDASAIAIYGSRGANGVIIITTKHGKYGEKPKIDFSASEGRGWAPADRVWKTTTGPEHALLVNEYNQNIGKPLPFRPKEELVNGVPGRGIPSEQPTYDRMQYLNRTANLRNYDLSLQGGSQTTKYYIGGGYNKQESIWKPMGFERYSFKANIDQKIGKNITVGTSNVRPRGTNLLEADTDTTSRF